MPDLTFHLWGAKAIQARLDVKSESTLRRLIAVERLPVYKRPRNTPGGAVRRMLYTNEALLLVWELSRCEAYYEDTYGGRPLPYYVNPRARQITPRDCLRVI